MGLIEAIKKYNLTNPISNVENSDAFSYFLNNGIPTNKDEEWKYTSLKQLVSNDFSVEAEGEEISQDELDKSTLKTKHQIIFLNGEMVKKPEIDGVLVTSYIDKNPLFENGDYRLILTKRLIRIVLFQLQRCPIPYQMMVIQLILS